MDSMDEMDAVGVVLAGGQSSRMGRDKALLPFAGRPLIEHALETLKAAGLSVAIAGATPDARAALAAYAPIIRDSERGLGPLAGICAALESTSTQYAAFLPVDMPLLPASLITYLVLRARVSESAVAVTTVNGIIQTFPAVLDRRVLPAVRAALHSEKRGCFSAFQTAAESVGQTIACVAVELLAQSGKVAHPLCLPSARWFLNLNTPPDLGRAEQFAAHAIA